MRRSAVTSILVIVGAALGTALVALLGAYIALPMIAPHVASEAESGAPAPAPPDSTIGPGADSSNAPSSMTTAAQAPADTAAGDVSDSGATKALQDSLETLQRRLRRTREEADTLREEAEMLREKLAAAQADRVKVEELSDALLDMRRRGLTNLLRDVEMSVLEKLYQQTSGRARTRLLRAMAPARAAQFVNQVVEGDTVETSSAPE